ncbi:LexA family protein [Succinimonas sp.]|uniref:LexA family protein n=1 Tax=Succinimonas sp. TaxID=1936151 RepID=UPI003862F438
MSGFSDRLKSLMDAKGITNKALADMIGVSPTMIGKYLKGAEPDKEKQSKIASALGTSEQYLMNGNRAACKEIPLINWVQAGTFSEMADSHYDETILVPPDMPDGCYALEVIGDSMDGGPKPIIPGSIIVIKPCAGEWSPEELNHCVVVALHENKATLKEFVVDGGNCFLRPWNKEYHIIDIDENVQIIGVLIHMITSFRNPYGIK